jgi:hemerythrin-like metal-binding protein
MDQHHKKLFDLINQLYDAMNSGKGSDVTAKILGDLINYTKFHFGAEEQLQQKYGYPNFAAHKKLHEVFTAKIAEQSEKLKSGQTVLPVSLSIFLKDWLQNHILKEDKKYGEHIAHQPV